MKSEEEIRLIKKGLEKGLQQAKTTIEVMKIHVMLDLIKIILEET